MATKVYDMEIIELVDGTEIEISPLKVKYLREFMAAFEFVKLARTDAEAVIFLTECVRICMKQFYPVLKTIADVEDSLDLDTLYKIIDIAAGIKMKQPEDQDVPVNKQASNAEEDSAWETLDLAKLESEVFLLGIWKDYDELERSMSMPEIVTTISQKRDLDYQEKKFLAAIQGVNLDENASEPDAWEEMKARVFSGGTAANSDDILSMQGINAQQAGFGIGMGLDYEELG